MNTKRITLDQLEALTTRRRRHESQRNFNVDYLYRLAAARFKRAQKELDVLAFRSYVYNKNPVDRTLHLKLYSMKQEKIKTLTEFRDWLQQQPIETIRRWESEPMKYKTRYQILKNQ